MQPFSNQPFSNQPFPNMMQPAHSASLDLSWKVAFATISVQYTPETIAAKAGMKSWSVPRAMIDGWAVGDRSGDAEGIQSDLSKLLMLGAWGEIIVAYRTPSGGRSFERVNIDANSRECQALIQALWTEMPDRFRGLGPSPKIVKALGFSNAGYWIKQVVVIGVVMALIAAAVAYLAISSGPSQ